MQQPRYQIRRATVEDIPWLRSLWQEAQLPSEALEKRFTDFQVILNQDEELLGAVGLTMVMRHGHIHSEAYTHPELEEALRPQLWERLSILARNHGLVRFWSMETSPFWTHYAGFREVKPEEIEKLPAGFGEARAHWLTLPLMDEVHHELTVEQHLELFHQEQQENIEKMRRRAKQLRTLAALLAVALFVVVLVGGLLLLTHRHGPMGR